MTDLVHISYGAAGAYAILGYCVVFLGLALLLGVLLIMTKIMSGKKQPEAVPEAAEAMPAAPEVPVAVAAGTAGEVKLYDTDPRDAAMIMAIVADSLGKPVNELRFISIREVKSDEV